ncbi:MAG TPA: hypothetical protein VJT82_10015, partial [Pyrinomonadaceae bacterium]|nr:hypothetical protein [Pyrinomonadaceae bacterium]
MLCAPLAPVFGSDGGKTAAGDDGSAAAGATERGALSISVEGIVLTGAFALPQQRGGRLFLPLASIARALGDAVRVEPS